MHVTIIFYESALELIPENMRKNPLISKEWRRNVKNKNRGILLDGAIHQPLITSLENFDKRGRPDIIHHSLINLSYSPLIKAKKVNIIIHTINNECITIPPDWRVPVNYNRFCGLFAQLLLRKRVPLDNNPILTVFKSSLPKLLEGYSNSTIYLCEIPSKNHEQEISTIRVNEIPNLTSVIFLIGGFQHGETTFYRSLPEDILKRFNIVTMYEEIKPAWIISSKLIHWLEEHDN